MRRADDILHIKKRIGFGRFLFKYIERGTRHMAAFQRFFQRFFINQPAARAVNDTHAFFTFRQRLGADDIAGFLGQRRVQGDEIGARQDIVQIGFLNADFQRAFRR